MKLCSPFAAVVMSLTVVAGLPLAAADLPNTVVKLKHDERLATADILASDDGQFVFVNGKTWSGGYWQLNVLQTSNWNAAGPLKNYAKNGTQSTFRWRGSTLFYDAKTCELFVPRVPSRTTGSTSVGVLPTTPEALAALKGARGFPREITPGDLNSSTPAVGTVVVRSGGRFRGFLLSDGLRVSETTKAHTTEGFRIRGGDWESQSGMSVSPTGKHALIALENLELVRPMDLSDVRVEPSWKGGCLVYVSLDQMKALAGIDIPGAAVTASLLDEESQTAVCGRDDGSVLFVDLKKQEQSGVPLNATGNTIAKLCLSPDRKHLIASSLGSKDNIFVVDFNTRKLVPVGDLGNKAYVCAVGFSPKGDSLYTLNTHGEFFAWDFAKLVAPKPGK